MKLRSSVACTLLVLFVIGGAGSMRSSGRAAAQTAAAPAAQAAKLSPEELDGLLAPVALYPDQLLAQMLESSKIPRRVQEFSGWLVRNDELTGTALQDAAKMQGFEPSLVLLALFPKVINFMADNPAWTTQLGQAFTSDRASVFDSVQRLRASALKKGTLKTTPQQSVKLETKDGKDVIIIEPANPQVVYVPQYNPQTVYVTPPATTTTTVVVQQQSSSTEAAVVGAAIGFTAGIAIGAAMNNNYYYGPYGWHGGPYMYNSAYNDWYDDRQDAREDWYDNREDAREDIADNRQDLAEERTDRRENTQEQRTERSENRQNTQGSRQGTAQARSSSGQTRSTASASTATASTASADSRGTKRANSTTAPDRSGTKSDAFSGYSSGRSEKAASDRGKSSRSRSSSGGGGRSRRK